MFSEYVPIFIIFYTNLPNNNQTNQAVSDWQASIPQAVWDDE
jgi:hypothetical protein